uniref:Uncharacterized protein n=1 Tax=Phaseolus vulgaris TaxID=3885 RepID=V7AG99_PHAVU|nr:hypothetical protein PHAVU_011G082800g [Phaseolus vulgaris]ESW04290.1 hypothetical protein PHAVU_011G082800g [Phaseolus vulgaris]
MSKFHGQGFGFSMYELIISCSSGWWTKDLIQVGLSKYIQDLISWKSVCPHHFPTLGHIFSLLHHYECCVHCLSPKQLALFLCREGCGSYMHQAHSSSCSLSSLVKPHNFCGLFTLAVDKGGLSYAIRYPRQL